MPKNGFPDNALALLDQADAEMAALKAENARLRAALREALECLTAPGDGTVGDALRVIRGAVEQTGDGK